MERHSFTSTVFIVFAGTTYLENEKEHSQNRWKKVSFINNTVAICITLSLLLQNRWRLHCSHTSLRYTCRSSWKSIFSSVCTFPSYNTCTTMEQNSRPAVCTWLLLHEVFSCASRARAAWDLTDNKRKYRTSKSTTTGSVLEERMKNVQRSSVWCVKDWWDQRITAC